MEEYGAETSVAVVSREKHHGEQLCFVALDQVVFALAQAV